MEFIKTTLNGIANSPRHRGLIARPCKVRASGRPIPRADLSYHRYTQHFCKQAPCLALSADYRRIRVPGVGVVANVCAVWRPSSLTRYINGRTASRKESSRPQLGLDDNKRVQGPIHDEATNPSEMRAINQKLRKAIESEGRVERIEGLWWQFSLTVRGPQEPSA